MKSLTIVSGRFIGLVLVLGGMAVPLAFAYASVSVSVQALSPSTNVSVGTAVSFTVSASGFSSPTYSVDDSLSGTSVSSGNINSSGNFNWTPGTNDIGNHIITVTVQDSTGNTATAQEQIFVTSPASLSIQSLNPGSSVNAGQTVTFTAAAAGFGGPTYSVSDSFSGSTITTGDMSNSGYFTWTPQAQDAGTHTLTVSVNDPAGHSATAQTTITINSTPTATVQALSPGNSVAVGTALGFTLATSGFSNPAFTISDSFSGSTISNAAINSSGVFSWTPSASDAGTHNLTIYISDSSGHTAAVTQQITVQSPSVAVTSISPGEAVAPGSALTVTASAPGFVSPTYSLTDSFSGSTLTSADLNSSSGVLTWTPSVGDVGVHTLTLSATDSYGHSASTNVTIDVSNSNIPLSVVPTSSTLPASGLSTTQIQAILSLLQSFGADQGTIANVSAALGGGQTTATVGTDNSYTFTDFLSLASTGAEVTALQNKLAALGYFSASATGYFGAVTQAAVKAFQSAHGIDAVGYVGPATRAALNQ